MRVTSASGKKIVILGGGFAGVYTARHLEHLLGPRSGVEVTLVSRNNYFLMTPLLFEAGSGVLEPRHAVNPIRPLFKRVRFIEAEVQRIDFERRCVLARLGDNEPYDIPYDHLVLALGGVTNTAVVKGAEHAMTFKTLADAIYLRNHTIQRFEEADVEEDPQRKAALLTFAIIGAGLVGLELQGELTEFVHNVRRQYKNVRPDEIRLLLIEHGPRIVPELDADLADYASNVLKRRGVDVRVNASVDRVEPRKVHLKSGQCIIADTILLTTGVVPNPLVAALPIEKDKRGRALVEPTLRAKGRDDLWALGDCASIPSPTGRPYPALAQHAMREARVAAENVVASLHGRKLKPFIYESMGTLAALGHFSGTGRVYSFKIYGFLAWWVWRTYYLMQMPRMERRLRIVIDWTVALFFKNDVVQLDFYRDVPSPRNQSTQCDPSASSTEPKPEAPRSPAST